MESPIASSPFYERQVTEEPHGAARSLNAWTNSRQMIHTWLPADCDEVAGYYFLA